MLLTSRSRCHTMMHAQSMEDLSARELHNRSADTTDCAVELQQAAIAPARRTWRLSFRPDRQEWCQHASQDRNKCLQQTGTARLPTPGMNVSCHRHANGMHGSLCRPGYMRQPTASLEGIELQCIDELANAGLCALAD